MSKSNKMQTSKIKLKSNLAFARLKGGGRGGAQEIRNGAPPEYEAKSRYLYINPLGAKVKYVHTCQYNFLMSNFV
jgi:hypothetical protein